MGTVEIGEYVGAIVGVGLFTRALRRWLFEKFMPRSFAIISASVVVFMLAVYAWTTFGYSRADSRYEEATWLYGPCVVGWMMWDLLALSRHRR